MKRVILFGASGGGRRLYPLIASQYDVIAFTDNDNAKWGTQLFGKTVLSPDECFSRKDYDFIIITSVPGLDSIYEQCVDMGIPEANIITSYVIKPLESRVQFLENLAMVMQENNVYGDVAEAGVFEGDFAKHINRCYPKSQCHLFDTFSGFAPSDISKENMYSDASIGEYGNTSVEMVMNKMPYPNMVHIYVGVFPESADKVEGKFCFVNLDLDLYEPTYQGLLFFSKRMVSHGLILVHDYFADNFKGPHEAVNRFLKSENKLVGIPIGDGFSMAIVGF